MFTKNNISVSKMNRRTTEEGVRDENNEHRTSNVELRTKKWKGYQHIRLSGDKWESRVSGRDR